MTWGEFKKQMEDAGVIDADRISYFDFSKEPQGGIKRFLYGGAPAPADQPAIVVVT